jgi:hypothetical protein
MIKTLARLSAKNFISFYDLLDRNSAVQAPFIKKMADSYSLFHIIKAKKVDILCLAASLVCTYQQP